MSKMTHLGFGVSICTTISVSDDWISGQMISQGLHGRTQLHDRGVIALEFKDGDSYNNHTERIVTFSCKQIEREFH
jgi:hypothetical protein